MKHHKTQTHTSSCPLTTTFSQNNFQEMFSYFLHIARPRSFSSSLISYITCPQHWRCFKKILKILVPIMGRKKKTIYGSACSMVESPTPGAGELPFFGECSGSRSHRSIFFHGDKSVVSVNFKLSFFKISLFRKMQSMLSPSSLIPNP